MGAEFWEYDTRSGRRWNLDPKPTVGISEYSVLNNNPILFTDPAGDTLSDPQLVSALKIAGDEIKNRIQNNQSFYSGDYKENLNRAFNEYVLKNTFDKTGDAVEFHEAIEKYYIGLGAVAMVSTSDFTSLNSEVINNKNVSSIATIFAANFSMNRANNRLWTMMGASLATVDFISTVGLFPEVGLNPKGTLINSGTQQAIVDAKSIQIDNIITNASKGKGNFGLGTSTYSQAVKAGEAWVGQGYTIASDGKTLISINKLRAFRPPSFKPKLGITQANFEERSIPNGRWASNGHLDIKK